MNFLRSVFGRGREHREHAHPRVASQSELSSGEARYRIGARWVAAVGAREGGPRGPVPPLLGAVSRPALFAACQAAVAGLVQGSIVELVAQRDGDDLQASLRRVVGAFCVAAPDGADAAPGADAFDEAARDVAVVAVVLLLFARERDAVDLTRALLEGALRPLGCFGGGGLHACGIAVAEAASGAYPRLAECAGRDALAIALETLTPRLVSRAFADAVPLTALIAV